MSPSTDPGKTDDSHDAPAHEIEKLPGTLSIHSDITGTSTAHSQSNNRGEDGDKNHVQDEVEEAEELHFAPVAPTVSIIGPVDGDANLELGLSKSQASTTASRTLVIVPRSQRRGLLGRLSLVPEVERPCDYKNSTKWGITFIIALAAAAAPLGSSIFYPALPAMTKELHTDETITNLSVALYMVAMSIFPLWWSSFSEQFGRRTIYLISFALYVVFAVVCAVSTNIAMLIVFRILTGGASASVQAVGAGTIADIWESRERGRAMGIFYLGPLMGPMVAPIVGGALAQGFGWKATMWFLAIYGVVIWFTLLFFLPETLARKKPEEKEELAPQPELLRRMTTTESAKVHTKKFAAGAKRIFLDPLSVLLFLRFPPVLITVFMGAIAFGALFVQNISIQQKFTEEPYNYSQIILGLLYLPAGLGYFLSSLFSGRWTDRIMAREAKKANRYDDKGRLLFLPEDRVRENMWIATCLYPAGLLIYGWTLNYGVIFIVPAIGSFIFGVASMLVFSAATTMLTEFVRKKSSAGVAVNNFVRNILSCVGVIVTAPWIKGVGVGWVFTTVALFCIVAGYICMWVLMKNASKWRKDMDEALNEV